MEDSTRRSGSECPAITPSCLHEVVQAERWGLVTDIDGTLASIAPTPDEARVDPGCRHYLRLLASRLPLVAALTGRPADEARRLLRIDQMVYVGNHGLEQWSNGTLRPHPGAQAHRPAIQAALLAIREQLGAGEGLRYEDKGLTVSVHYRSASDPDLARSLILEAISRVHAASPLRITEGKMVVELRPPVAIDKGTALMELIAEHRLQGAIYLGDDTTDLDAFRALQVWRQSGDGVGCTVAVAGSETPPALTASADLVLAGVAGVRTFLGCLSEVTDCYRDACTLRRDGGR